MEIQSSSEQDLCAEIAFDFAYELDKIKNKIIHHTIEIPIHKEFQEFCLTLNQKLILMPKIEDKVSMIINTWLGWSSAHRNDPLAKLLVDYTPFLVDIHTSLTDKVGVIQQICQSQGLVANLDIEEVFRIQDVANIVPTTDEIPTHHITSDGSVIQDGGSVIESGTSLSLTHITIPQLLAGIGHAHRSDTIYRLTDIPSPKLARYSQMPKKYICIHGSACPNNKSFVYTMQSNTDAAFGILDDGTIVQFADVEKCMGGIGRGNVGGDIWTNQKTIGIEIQAPKDGKGDTMIPNQKQIEAVQKLTHHLCKQYHIGFSNITSSYQTVSDDRGIATIPGAHSDTKTRPEHTKNALGVNPNLVRSKPTNITEIRKKITTLIEIHRIGGLNMKDKANIDSSIRYYQNMLDKMISKKYLIYSE